MRVLFHPQDKASWQAEQDIYNLPRMEHENILKFLGVERRGENLQVFENLLPSIFLKSV